MSTVFVSKTLENRLPTTLDLNSNSGWEVTSPISGRLLSFGKKQNQSYIKFNSKDIESCIKLIDGSNPTTFIIINAKLDVEYQLTINDPDMQIDIISQDKIQMLIKESSNVDKK